METRDYLHMLCERQGPSGFERPVAEIAAEAIKPFVDKVEIDNLGNLIATKKSRKKNARKMLIAAHLDEIGLIVTGHEDGFLSFGQIGGVDTRMLPGRDLIIMTKTPMVGVVCAMPPHVLSHEDMEKAIPMEDLRIDVGLSQKEAVKKIPIGTPIAFRTEGFNLGEDLYVSKTLDDRACFVSLILAAKLLKGKSLPWDVVFVGSTCEETGGAGAAVATFAEAPLACAAIDVTHGITPDMQSEAQGFELGKGPSLSVGPNISRIVGKQMEKVAKDNGIPYHIEVQPGRTGTDAWAMQIVKEGVATGLIGLPLKYMHTPVETVSIKDIEYCAQLVAAYAQDPGEELLSC
ncbi:MAG: M20/M25/M40 family metallo-hydrolase [Clostridia bacterium]|nr:M20/M25/M40 family metallo-hydrolase [Clostridia bacterium]